MGRAGRGRDEAGTGQAGIGPAGIGPGAWVRQVQGRGQVQGRDRGAGRHKDRNKTRHCKLKPCPVFLAGLGRRLPLLWLKGMRCVSAFSQVSSPGLAQVLRPGLHSSNEALPSVPRQGCLFCMTATH